MQLNMLVAKLPITKNVNWFKNPSDGVTFEQVYAKNVQLYLFLQKGISSC